MHELRVLNGQQQGAALPLIGQQWLLGSDVACDLQLEDAAIQPCHAQLQWLENGWQLLAAEGDIAREPGQNGREPLALALEQTFWLGQTALSLADAAAPWPQLAPVSSPATQPQQPSAPATRSLFPRWAQIAAVSMMLLFTLTVTSWILQSGVARTEPQSMHSLRPQLKESTALRDKLSHLLRERELQQVVEVTAQRDAVTLRGELDESQRDILQRMLQMVRDNYTLGVKLRDDTQQREVKLPFSIKQITAGPGANIVTSEGQRLFIGDERDGLRLVAITASQVEFAGRRNITVKW